MGNEKYYIGLDMGTNSVGWAVTNEQYELLRAKGKDLWGVRLFDEASTSAERRTFRVARRRRQRERARMGMLRMLFADAIDAIDPGFFARLDDSKYQMQERAEHNKQPFALFADTGYTDKEYYQEFPTIFHLRKRLLECNEPQDVRLVYLALANLYKRRGHFLNASLDEESTDSNMQQMYNDLQLLCTEYEIVMPQDVNGIALEQILGEKGLSRKRISENVMQFLKVEKSNKAAVQLINAICGLKVELAKIFGEESISEDNKKLSIGFREGNYEEMLQKAQEALEDNQVEIILLAKQIHDKGLLANIMKGYDFLSQARVASYDKHQEDLKRLKKVLKHYDVDAYDEMFRVMRDGNYSSYIGSVNSSYEKKRRNNGDRSVDSLYKKIKNILKNLPQNDEDIVYILEQIEEGLFLPKQLTFENGVIPNQVHYREMVQILKNAQNYLPFLSEKDDSGYTVAEKILQIYKFRIPYYVGPLGQEYKDRKGYNVWAERKESGKIYPWNFEQKIDLKRSAEKFIERMVRHCTYLTGEMALPKTSLLYEKFQVLNELNNLRVHGEKLSVEMKQDIFKKLFGQGKKVTLKRLAEYLESNGLISHGETDAISGIDGGFKSSLTTVGKFYGILGETVYSDENRKMIEDIVFWGTIYGDDKKFLCEKIDETYGSRLSDKDLKRILGFKFEGWGRLSKAFLELEGASTEDGVVRGLLTAMWETNDNLMELLSRRYTYVDTLQEMVSGIEKELSEWTIDDLDELYLSAPVKRMVWQTLSIIKELVEVKGSAPERIFVEMARAEGEKGKRTDSRKKKLLDLYQAIGREANEWKKEVEEKSEDYFRNRRIYLYYLQLGKCMYSGDAIDFDALLRGEKYDLDHIFPRHFIKDDSLENNLVLVDREFNAHKSDTFPIESLIRQKQLSMWKYLRSKI